ncbi:MAG: hypothetical protein IPJ88_06995 [Myxococcales bacterium]|nr:MAG: hypothetical protein IPJ88_06995 [Myxococcales bacterium]
MLTRTGAQWLALQMGGMIGLRSVQDLKAIGRNDGDFDEYLRRPRTGVIGGLVNLFDPDNLPAIESSYANGALYECETDPSNYSSEFTESPYHIDQPFTFGIYKAFLDLWKSNGIDFPTGECGPNDRDCIYSSALMRWGRPMSPFCRSQEFACGTGEGIQVFERAVFRYGHGPDNVEVTPLAALLQLPESKVAECSFDPQSNTMPTDSLIDDSPTVPEELEPAPEEPTVNHACARFWPYEIQWPVAEGFKGVQSCVTAIWQSDMPDEILANGTVIDYVNMAHADINLPDGNPMHSAMSSMPFSVNLQVNLESSQDGTSSAQVLQSLKNSGQSGISCLIMLVQAKNFAGSDFEILALRDHGDCSAVSP